jgi:atypical dual specificity phosphatase
MLVNFSWIRAGRLAGMGLPYAGAWAALRDAGVRAVLTLTEFPLEDDADAAGFETLHVPLRDFGRPSIQELERCVNWIDDQLDVERSVAVHCFAGVGRTGTVLAAWMVAQGQQPEEAIAELRRLRPGSVETAGQEEAIVEFSKRVSNPSGITLEEGQE